MRKLRIYRPMILELESRVVLDAGSRGVPLTTALYRRAERGVSGNLGSLPRDTAAAARALTRTGLAAPIRAQKGEVVVARAFDSFRADYFAAQKIYLTPPNNDASGRAAFENVVTQRVNLLAQDVTTVLLRSLDQRKKSGGDGGISAFLKNRLTSTTPSSLLGGLRSATPPIGTTSSGAPLYSIAAEDSIDAAETATLNAMAFTRSGVFRGKHG